jgi:uncharacterized protein
MLAPTRPAMESPLSPPAPARFSGLRLGLSFLVLLGLYALGFVIGGEVGSFMGASLTAIPLTVVAVLAYLGSDRIWARVLAGVALAGMIGVYALYGLGLSYVALVEPGHFALRAGSGWQFATIFLGLALGAPLSALAALPAVRRWFARFLPIDPNSFVHLIALVLVIALIVVGFIPLLVLGAPPILSALANAKAGGQDLLGGQTSAEQLRAQFYGLVWTIPCAALAVGWGVRRNGREALQRLGLVRPTARQVFAALGLAVLAVIASRLLDFGIAAVWGQFGWPTTDQAQFGELLSFAMSPIGAVVLGVSAGLGEELAVRGVLQPRMGILLSNVVFTSLHALQYNWDALLSVFLIGLLMGVVRRRTNTSTSAIVHGTYDFLLVILTLLPIPWFS